MLSQNVFVHAPLLSQKHSQYSTTYYYLQLVLNEKKMNTILCYFFIIIYFYLHRCGCAGC